VPGVTFDLVRIGRGGEPGEQRQRPEASTQRIDTGQFGVPRTGTRRRGRVEGHATLPVIEGFASP
jgi:hypothetical protein